MRGGITHAAGHLSPLYMFVLPIRLEQSHTDRPVWGGKEAKIRVEYLSIYS